MTATGVPLLKDEIDRKAHETLEWLVNSVLNDKISPETFSFGLDVLFMAVSGLAGKDFIELITKAGDIAKSDAEPVLGGDSYGVW